MANQINTIIFDLGGVLIDWNPLYVFNDLIPDAERRKEFFDNICTMHWNEQQDAGTPIAQATEERIALFPAWENEIRAYYGRWVEMLGDANHGTVEILKSLIDSPDYRVYALTNWSAETFPIAKSMERFQFLHWFEGILVSGEEFLLKPQPEIYEAILERYDIDRHKAVFIDDNYKNVVGSEAVGLKAIHFTTPEKLAEELRQLTVNI
ncbi:2-haloacid dehalogenase [Arcicella aurantiaca]|uniref:2-haloacid dehalogenase n=1 Tax=Arcicella aurantiaca TaxID=591202 RepID=A0A316EFW6_9BACT|nr:HAD family phosphatase [Arcicella aurantiaca]PWK28647.1 2-haloacid dehalogenase [Arcicella aurantiaca]